MSTRRRLLLVVGLAVIFVLLPLSAALAFTDVGPTTTYATAITDLSNRTIISGFDDGTFRPFDPVKRMQLPRSWRALSTCPPRSRTSAPSSTFTAISTPPTPSILTTTSRSVRFLESTLRAGSFQRRPRSSRLGLAHYPGYKNRNQLQTDLQILGGMFLQDIVKDPGLGKTSSGSVTTRAERCLSMRW